MPETISHWRLDVERGPEWLFIKVRQPLKGIEAHDADGLCELIWDLARIHFCFRVVLEMNEVELLFSSLIGQLARLGKRIHEHDGILRIAGLSDRNQDVLHTCRMEAALPNFANRGAAVMGHRS